VATWGTTDLRAATAQAADLVGVPNGKPPICPRGREPLSFEMTDACILPVLDGGPRHERRLSRPAPRRSPGEGLPWAAWPGEEAKVIRPMAGSDRAAWEKLWQLYLRFYRTAVPDAVTAATFDRLVGRTDGLAGFVAEDEQGEIVGFAHLVFHASTWSVDQYCYLEDLFVLPSHRGTGVAGDLLRTVFSEADRRGVGRTYWETQEYNGAARSLYDQVAHRTSFIVYER